MTIAIHHTAPSHHWHPFRFGANRRFWTALLALAIVAAAAPLAAHLFVEVQRFGAAIAAPASVAADPVPELPPEWVWRKPTIVIEMHRRSR